jgi:hypothetical protein
MDKAYLVYESWSITADSSVVGVFLDEKKADEYVEIHSEKRRQENERYEKCFNCRNKICKSDEEGNGFNFKDTCENAVIKKDRHGLYCENDNSDFYETVYSNDYWKVEVDILG